MRQFKNELAYQKRRFSHRFYLTVQKWLPMTDKPTTALRKKKQSSMRNSY